MAFTVSLLLQKGEVFRNAKYLSLVPLIYAVNDVLENLCIDVSIVTFPRSIPVLANSAGYFTVIKMTALYASFFIIAVALLLIGISYIKRRLLKNSANE